MSQYILIISKLKPKNDQTFKLMDLTDVEVDVDTSTYNMLYVTGSTFAPSGVNWNSGSSTFTINGDLVISPGHNLYEYSDIRLKLNIIIILLALDKILNINGVSFDWKLTKQKDYGFIAQLILKIIPLMVTTLLSGLKQVNYIKLIPFLLLAIKLLTFKVSQLLDVLNK